MKRNAMSRGVAITCLVMLAAGFSPVARAQTDYSFNVAAGNFNVAGSWTPAGGPPADGDRAFINNGGTASQTAPNASAATEVLIGVASGNSGTLNMTGGTLTANKVVVGEGGTGTMTHSGGDLVVGGGSLFVGGSSNGNTGTGTLNVSGGPTTTFSSGDDVQFARNGTATFNMSGGFGHGGYTVVAKFGTATWNHSGGVYDQDFGDIEIGDGGVPDDAGIPGARSGTINLSGGVIQVAGSFAIGNRNGTGVVNVTGGVLAATGDAGGNGTIFVGRGMNWDPGTGGPTSLRVKGGGSIIVANGAFDMNSSGVASSSTLIAEITGTSHSTIKVAGDALIANGSLKVELNGYTPVSGNSWTLLEAGADLTADLTAIDNLVQAGGYLPLLHNPGAIVGTLQGTFANTNFTLAPLSPGLTWNVGYASNKVTLSVTGTASFEADFNDDGKVNSADLTVWRGAFGLTAAGDANGDGDSDGADFLVWQRQLGSGGPAVGAVGAVPEPTSLGMTAMAGLLAGGFRRRRG